MDRENGSEMEKERTANELTMTFWCVTCGDEFNVDAGIWMYGNHAMLVHNGGRQVTVECPYDNGDNIHTVKLEGITGSTE